MMKRKRQMLGLTSVGMSVKLPVGLRDRIDYLALRYKTSRNAWIVNRLIHDARWELPLPQPRKRPSINSSELGKEQ